MKETWIYSKVSTPERCLAKISSELPRPLGIIIFGIDNSLKDRVERLCIRHVPYLIGGTVSESYDIVLREASQKFRDERNVIVILNEETSCNHELRHQVVTNMRNSGIESVVGLYVESGLKQPPTADGLEALITIPKEGIL